MPQKERNESAVKSPGEEGGEKKERKKQVTAPPTPSPPPKAVSDTEKHTPSPLTKKNTKILDVAAVINQ